MENNKINIAEILKDCPKGTKLYSPIFGNVSFEKLIDNVVYPIHVVGQNSRQIYFSEYGLYIADDSCSDAECQLFPSREVRDWNKFSDMEKYFGGKYNPETLQVEPVEPECPFKPFGEKIKIKLEEIKELIEEYENEGQ